MTVNGAAQHPMHILEVETFGRGGLAHYAYNLSLALAERGHRITVLTAAGYELEARERPENVRVVQTIGRVGHRLGDRLPGDRLPDSALGLWRKLEAIFDAFAVAVRARQLQPDVIHIHCTNPIVLLYLETLQRIARRPLAATAHVVTPHEQIGFQDAVYRRVHGLGQLIIAHSQFDRQRLLDEFAVEPQRVTVIPHGEYGFFDRGGEPADRAAARESLGLGPDDEVALFFGYIREYKGLDILLEAWPEVVAARPAARLVVAGDPVRLGPERHAELERWAQRVGAVSHFRYIPFSDVARYFAAADTLVMPYRHISQSGVLYLALSMGVPVVATRVGALPEMLEEGDSALLVPSESPKELATALSHLLGDPPLQQRLARGGQRIAQDHSWPSIAESTERAFAQLVGGPVASP